MEGVKQLATATLIYAGCASKPKPKELTNEEKLNSVKMRIEDLDTELARLAQEKHAIRVVAIEAARKFQNFGDPVDKRTMDLKLQEEAEKVKDIAAITTHKRELQDKLHKTKVGYLGQIDIDLMTHMDEIQAQAAKDAAVAEDARINYLTENTVDTKDLEVKKKRREELERQQREKLESFDTTTYVADQTTAILNMIADEKQQLKEEIEKANTKLVTAAAPTPSLTTTTTFKNANLSQQAKIVAAAAAQRTRLTANGSSA